MLFGNWGTPLELFCSQNPLSVTTIDDLPTFHLNFYKNRSSKAKVKMGWQVIRHVECFKNAPLLFSSVLRLKRSLRSRWCRSASSGSSQQRGYPCRTCSPGSSRMPSRWCSCSARTWWWWLGLKGAATRSWSEHEQTNEHDLNMIWTN